ncbi:MULTISPECIES: hypothetical protein [Amycolatopsis]|uniref:ACT domain-containing protein n=1 Tax=Amycolatopsis albidoflavus TaxID=102226 RepID=A0ABW5I3K5_9PSEU
MFFATGIADLFVSTLSNNRVGPALLFALGGLFIVSATLRHRWSHRRPRRATVPESADATEWRLRATVRDVPGSLAALTATLAAHRYDIAAMQVLAVPDGAVDEFLLRAPDGTTGADLAEAARSGGGDHVWVVRADVHELVDLPTRMLALAGQAAAPGADLAQLIGTLLGPSCTVRRKAGRRGRDERLTGTTMLLHGRAGELLEAHRPSLPFTPAEFARAQALVRVYRQSVSRAEHAPPSDADPLPRTGNPAPIGCLAPGRPDEQ